MNTDGWITVSRNSYFYQVWLISQDATELMSDRLGVDLSYEGQNLPAVLMLNEPPRFFRRLLSSYFKLQFCLTSRLVRISPPLRLV